jgi:2-dehydro-3-deoxygluconokinase
MRLSPFGQARLLQAEALRAHFGGAEANVAVSLAQFGVEATLVSRLPQHALGQAALNALRRYGVDVRYVARGDERLGLYFLEPGAHGRPAQVLYDRADSAFAHAQRADFDWLAILAGADWFHLSGITPALGGTLPDICADALAACHALGVRVSLDLNYRAALWSRDTAFAVLTPLLPFVDVLIANVEHAKEVLSITVGETELSGGEINRARVQTLAQTLAERYAFSAVALMQRNTHSASSGSIGAMLWADDTAHFSRTYTMQIVDRVGSGDAFAAGLIYATLGGQSPQERVDFALAAACLAHGIEGDFNLVSAAEVQRLLDCGTEDVRR